MHNIHIQYMYTASSWIPHEQWGQVTWVLFRYKDCLSRYRDFHYKEKIDGLVQDCSNSIANALELLQSCTKPSVMGLRQSYLYNGNSYTGKMTSLYSGDPL